MSLPARQQRALDRIEKTLMADDPRFGSLFAIFTRLTWHEAMPGIELVKSGRWHSLRPFAAIAIALIAVASVLVLTLLAPRRPICLTSAAGPVRTRWHIRGAVPGLARCDPAAPRHCTGGTGGAWRGWRSVPEGVLDLRPRLLGVALDLVTTALGAQAPAAGDPAG